MHCEYECERAGERSVPREGHGEARGRAMTHLLLKVDGEALALRLGEEVGRRRSVRGDLGGRHSNGAVVGAARRRMGEEEKSEGRSAVEVTHAWALAPHILCGRERARVEVNRTGESLDCTTRAMPRIPVEGNFFFSSPFFKERHPNPALPRPRSPSRPPRSRGDRIAAV